MEEIKIFSLDEIDSHFLVGAEGFEEGWIKRVVYPPYVDAKNFYMCILEVNPGFYAHRWHTHTSDRAKGVQIVFPEGYVEIYHLINGRGVMQWKTKDGSVVEKTVGAGDTIYFPVDVTEHQLFNDGTDRMRLLVVGAPAPQITLQKEMVLREV